MFQPEPIGIGPTVGYNDGPNGPSSFLLNQVGAIARGNPQSPLQALIQHLASQHSQQQQYQPGLDLDLSSLGNHQPNASQQRFNQVHMAQGLARFLAQQHTAGLRRYSGRA